MTCDNCGGSGYVVEEHGGCSEDGENDSRESVQEKCTQCDGTGCYNPDPICADCGSDLDGEGNCKLDCANEARKGAT